MIALIRKSDLGPTIRGDIVDIVRDQPLSSHCLSVYRGVRVNTDQVRYWIDVLKAKGEMDLCTDRVRLEEAHIESNDVSACEIKSVFVKRKVIEYVDIPRDL